LFSRQFFPIQKGLVLIAVAVLAALIAVTQPISATVIAPEINQGATIYIGEEGLDITHALNQAHGQSSDISAVPGNTRIGWWGAGSTIASSSPIRTIELNGSYRSFIVDPALFVGYTNNWYLMDNTTDMADLTNGGVPRAVFSVADPWLDVSVWDFDQSLDVSGRSVPSGERLGFRIKTTMYSALDDRYRSPVTHTDSDGYIDITVKNEQGTTLTSLTTASGMTTPLTHQAGRTYSSLWPSADGSLYWQTDAKDGGGADLYPAGTYTIGAVSMLNNMRENYKNAGADYTGKTVSQTKTVTLVPPALTLEANRDSVVRSNRFSLTIRGNPSTQYYLWVRDDGDAPLPVNEVPPSILPSSKVIQDPVTGPYPVGTYTLMSGRSLQESVPPSLLDPSLHYAAVMTNKNGQATVEIQTWNATRPATYTFCVEGESRSGEVSVSVTGGNIPVSPAGIDPAKVIQNPRINQEFPDTAQTSDYEVIVQGATIFIGEGGLNVTAALNQAQGNSALPYADPGKTKIGWWASAGLVPHTGPIRTVDLGARHTSLTVGPADFVGYTGNWYLVDPDTGMADLLPLIPL